MRSFSSDALLALPAFKDTLASLSAADLPALPALPADLYDEARTHTSWYGFPSDGFLVGSSRPGSASGSSSASKGEGSSSSSTGAPLDLPRGNKTRSEFERFEFLGDAILSTALALIIYTTYPRLAEGVMSSLKGALQANKTLAPIAHAYGLQGTMRVHGSAMAMKTNADHPVVAKLFEVFVAAIYLEHGMDRTIAFLRAVYAPLLLPSAFALLEAHNAKMVAQAQRSDTDPSSTSFVNYVGKLQEWATRAGRVVEYRMLPSEGGRKGEPLVHRGEIWIGGERLAEERAETIKGVRHLLAKKAIEMLGAPP